MSLEQSSTKHLVSDSQEFKKAIEKIRELTDRIYNNNNYNISPMLRDKIIKHIDTANALAFRHNPDNAKDIPDRQAADILKTVKQVVDLEQPVAQFQLSDCGNHLIEVFSGNTFALRDKVKKS